MCDYAQESNAKTTAYTDSQLRGLGSVQGYSPHARPNTPREEAEKTVAYMQQEVINKQQAVAFLNANPAFDEFIMLIRKGIISI